MHEKVESGKSISLTDNKIETWKWLYSIFYLIFIC